MGSLEAEILEILMEADEDNDEDKTMWMDVDMLTRLTLKSRKRSARKKVRKILISLTIRKLVTYRDFSGIRGWKMVNPAHPFPQP